MAPTKVLAEKTVSAALNNGEEQALHLTWLELISFKEHSFTSCTQLAFDSS